ncbi:MAG: hypothetical protein GXO74_01260 [Calditrichaeota bacterium]|nr:hypothetical protein [Calditrichota bacterium]
MKRQTKNLDDWIKAWQTSSDLESLRNDLEHIDKVYENVRQELGRVLMSAEMLEIQEILENRIEELSDKVAA